MQQLITVLNPTIGSENLGDLVILESGLKYLRQMFPGAFFTDLPTHDSLGRKSMRLLKAADLAFVVGSNLMSSTMNKRSPWRLKMAHAWQLGNVVPLGVGWRSYQPPPNAYTRLLFQKLFKAGALLSVRDSYAEKQLRSAGLDNVVNTGCPSLWGLSPAHCARIPTQKAPVAVTTLTDYNRDATSDLALLGVLGEGYEKALLWIQGTHDLGYANELLAQLPESARRKIEFIAPNLAAYDASLDGDVDYLGTRLHAGIRALQHGRRALILAVDNRATEMGRDFRLPVAPREDVAAMRAFTDGSAPLGIELPQANIDRWVNQFGPVSPTISQSVFGPVP